MVVASRRPEATMSSADASSPTLSDEVLVELDEMIEHFNTHHADTAVFIVRHGPAGLDADGAQVIGVDRFGVDLEVVVGGNPARARLQFDDPVSDSSEVYHQILATLAGARVAAGPDVPLTSIEHE